MLEDIPLPRARHHFHDPIRNAGLNNNYGLLGTWFSSKFADLTSLGYWGYWPFDITGMSNLDRARGNEGKWEEDRKNNNLCNWDYARNSYELGLCSNYNSERDSYLALMFMQLGHICHLLEDMGVPAHVRNDFVMGHLVGGFQNNETGAEKAWYSAGNAFEAFVEKLTKDNKQIPERWFGSSSVNIPRYSKLADYWDKNICDSSGTQYQGLDSPPDSSWGLAEQTNYQFLSYSTAFKNDGSLQSFPHPSRQGTTLTSPENEMQFIKGYGVDHLARVTYSEYNLSYMEPITVSSMVVENAEVYEDYASITIPRTINFAAGLINYFFRGRLDVKFVEVIEVDGKDVIKIKIKNTSFHTDTNNTYALKGGVFSLYCDCTNEDYPGEIFRFSPVVNFTVDNWSESKVLNYYTVPGDELNAQFEIPGLAPGYVLQNYILVYKGDINPNETPTINDPDDPDAIAVGMFEPPNIIVAMCWIDESRGTYLANPTLYTNDLAEYREMLSQNPDVHSGCLVPPNPWYDYYGTIAAVIPQGHSAPPEISVELCNRPPALNEFINDFNRIRNTMLPEHIVLCVDNSGSMTYSTLGADYVLFKGWLQLNYPQANILERPMSPYQQWIGGLTGCINEALGN